MGVLVGVGAGVAASVAVGGPAVASDTSVNIVGVNQGYSPGSVTVDPGDTVTWTNRDPTPAPHNAICDDSCPESFSSGDPGATGTTGHYKFRYSGTYNYKCAVHPNMKGTVTVTGNVHPPAAAAAGGPSSTTASAVATANSGASATAVANSGASASASASSPSTPGAAGSASATAGGDQGKTALPPVGQLSLPQPQVRVQQSSSKGTAWWVLLPSALVLMVAAGACALAWLGPRPLRVRRRAEAEVAG
jgi:plastocyanin